MTSKSYSRGFIWFWAWPDLIKRSWHWLYKAAWVFEQISRSISAGSAAGLRNRQQLCLPKRPNSGCGLLWGLCKHPRMLTQRQDASHITDPSLPLPDILSAKQRATGRKDREDRKNRKWLQGERVLRRIVKNRWREGWRWEGDREERRRKGWMEGSRYNWMRNMNMRNVEEEAGSGGK